MDGDLDGSQGGHDAAGDAAVGYDYRLILVADGCARGLEPVGPVADGADQARGAVALWS